MATFETLVYYFQTYGVLDFLLPFLLVFTIVYAVTSRLPLFAGAAGKSFRIVISIALGLMFVVPHILGTFPLGYDPVQILNETLPSISLVGISAIMVLILLGIFGKKLSSVAAPFIAIISIGFVIYIFGAAFGLWRGPYDIFSWWSSETTELLIVLAVFGVIVFFITKEPSGGTGIGGGLKKGFDWVGSLIDDMSHGGNGGGGHP